MLTGKSPLPAEAIDFEKADGLVPAIVQHGLTGEVLMLGYMNAEALAATQEKGLVTFWSRSKKPASGRRAKPPAMCCVWFPSQLIATATRCWCRLCLKGRPAT